MREKMYTIIEDNNRVALPITWGGDPSEIMPAFVKIWGETLFERLPQSEPLPIELAGAMAGTRDKMSEALKLLETFALSTKLKSSWTEFFIFQDDLFVFRVTSTENPKVNLMSYGLLKVHGLKTYIPEDKDFLLYTPHRTMFSDITLSINNLLKEVGEYYRKQ